MIVWQITALEAELKQQSGSCALKAQDKVIELNLCKFIQICLRVRSFYSQIALKTSDPTPNVRPLRLLDVTVSLLR